MLAAPQRNAAKPVAWKGLSRFDERCCYVVTRATL